MKDWIIQAFKDFGRGLGLAGLVPGPDGGLSLRLGGDRMLAFQVLEETVLVMLSRPMPPGDPLATKSRALERCNQRYGWNLPVRAGLSREGDLVFLTRVPAREFRPQTIEQALDLLTRMHEQLYTS